MSRASSGVDIGGATKEFAPRKGWDPFFPPGLHHFSALAVSPSLHCGYDLRLSPGDLPKLGSNLAYVSFSTVSLGARSCFRDAVLLKVALPVGGCHAFRILLRPLLSAF